MGCSVLIRFICLYLEYVMEKSHKNAKKCKKKEKRIHISTFFLENILHSNIYIC